MMATAVFLPAVFLVLAMPQRSAPLDLVEVIGCLGTAQDGPWVVTQATEPVAATTPWTTVAAVKAAAGRALGARRYRLIGANPFSPAKRIGHKVAVKGVFINDAGAPRINVTSLQTAAVSCEKTAG
jgi:hypothetical protein